MFWFLKSRDGIHRFSFKTITFTFQFNSWEVFTIYTHLRLRVSVVVRKLRIALRPVVVRQLQHWSPRSTHSLVRRGCVSGGQRRNFFGRKGLQEVQAEAFEVELTHLPQEASPRKIGGSGFGAHGWQRDVGVLRGGVHRPRCGRVQRTTSFEIIRVRVIQGWHAPATGDVGVLGVAISGRREAHPRKKCLHLYR